MTSHKQQQAQFDSMARRYLKADKVGVEKMQSIVPTFYHILGDVKNKFVLDLACGYGLFTRGIKDKGATYMVGGDISKEMLKIANFEEIRNPKEIEYCQFDSREAKGVKKMLGRMRFDTVTAVFLLGYAETPHQMDQMCRNIYDHLVPKGRFVTIIDDNDDPRSINNRVLDTSFQANFIPRPGDKLELVLHRKGGDHTHEIVYWPKWQYHRSLSRAGFRNIQWYSPIVNPVAMTKNPEEWKKYLDIGWIKGITAVKPK